jgi:ABC-2 type transport system permease protein
LIGLQVSVLFLIMPTLLTSIIAAYSIIGGKNGRTLETLLAKPIRTWELLVGKALASIIPGVGLTWLAGAVFLNGLSHAAISD